MNILTNSKLVYVSPSVYEIGIIDTSESPILSVLIDPEIEEVVWNYSYINGKKIATGYQIQNKFNFNVSQTKHQTT